MQNKNDILDKLKQFKASYAHLYGIRTIGIFGSFARNQQNEKSDLDVVVTLNEPDFFTLEHIREELEKLFHLNIDIVNFRSTLRHSFIENIERDAIYV